MTQAQFTDLIATVTSAIAGAPLDASLQQSLNRRFPADGETFRSIQSACREAIASGWMCNREHAGIKYGRVVKPGPATQGFSVDVVDMAFSLSVLTGNLFVAIVVGIVLSVVLGIALEWALFSHLYRRDHLEQVLLSYGLILVFEELRSIIVGNDVHGVKVPDLLNWSIPLTDTLSYPVYRLFMPMAPIECDFLAPSKIGETLSLALAVKRIGRTSATLGVEGSARGEPRVRATLIVVLASMDTHRPVAIEGDLKARLERFAI